MISPYIHGIKTDQVMSGDRALSVEEHRREWNEILGNIAGAVDILAFQDGQVDYHELYDYLTVNKALADKYGMECWTNLESFDRDMPIRFLPIKWEKLPAQTRRRPESRNAERHHVRIFTLHESPLGLSAGGTPLRPLLRLLRNRLSLCGPMTAARPQQRIRQPQKYRQNLP